MNFLRALSTVLCVSLVLARVSAAPAGWMHLSSGALSLDAPAGSLLRQVVPGTWELHNRALTLGIAYGPKVADLDDGEPHRCYTSQYVSFNGAGGTLRTTRPRALIDCPEGYASLYVPPARPGAPALFLWVWGTDDPATLRAVVGSIRLQP